MKLVLITASLLMVGAVAQAKGGKPKDDPACANIAKQCEAQGFMPGAHKRNGKGLWADCVGKIAKGETIAGVNATVDEAKACAAAAKSHKAEKAP